MENLRFENLNFKYPLENENALRNITFNVKRGDFVLVCGNSGCGKSTLLRLIKPEIAPYGEKTGRILLDNTDISTDGKSFFSNKIGFVMQNPDEQIVTDKVWHELAFGLENSGMKTSMIRLKIAEIATFFGIDSWLEEKTCNLSGGQKQVLALASILATNPEILLLDEPIAQLDPIATENFINILLKINRNLGKAIIIADHSLEILLSIANNVLYMENGEIAAFSTPREVAEVILRGDFSPSLPTATRLSHALQFNLDVQSPPITVKDGRDLLGVAFANRKLHKDKSDDKKENKSEVVLEVKNVYFRYDKVSADILSDFSLEINKGEIFCLLGSNGVGKSTAVKVMAGLAKPYRGYIKILNRKLTSYKANSLYRGVVAMLPQNVSYCFVKPRLIDDFKHYCQALGLSENDADNKVNDVFERFNLSKYSTRNPFDLSGGEQQRAAIAKILINKPQILILDEPTKGIDCSGRILLGKILNELTLEGITVIVVTHDVEFAASYADRCGLLSQGYIVAIDRTRDFFSSLDFYTTAARRISEGFIERCVTCEQIVEALTGGECNEK